MDKEKNVLENDSKDIAENVNGTESTGTAGDVNAVSGADTVADVNSAPGDKAVGGANAAEDMDVPGGSDSSHPSDASADAGAAAGSTSQAYSPQGRQIRQEDGYGQGPDGYHNDFDEEEDDEKPRKKNHLGIVLYLLLLTCATLGAVYYVQKTGFEIPELNSFFSADRQPTEKEPEPDVEVQEQVWVMDVNSDINQMVRNYYVALQACDMEKLDELTDASVTTDRASVEAAAKYIEGYQNIKTYVAAGQKEGENSLYIAYDIKFRNISTTAPGLVPAYVRRDADGAPRLIPYESFDSAITAYMTGLSTDPEIVALRSSVTKDYDLALVADPTLAKFIEDLGNGVVNIPQPQEAESVDESASESVEAASETAADNSGEAGSAAEGTTESTAEGSAQNAPAAGAADQDTSAPDAGSSPVVVQAGAEVIDGIVFEPATIEMWTFDNLRARTSPSTDTSDNIATTLAPHTKVFVVGTSEVWYRILLENGAGPYFVHAEFLSEDPEHETTASAR